MATIYHIERDHARRAPVANATATGSAEIILFPGVRYERWSTPQSAEPLQHNQRGRKQRDRLDIAE